MLEIKSINPAKFLGFCPYVVKRLNWDFKFGGVKL